MRIKPPPGPYRLDPPGVTLQITEDGASIDYGVLTLTWEWVDAPGGPILMGLGFIAFEEGDVYSIIVKYEGKEICVGGGHYAPA
jgi:hypothetical protein